MIKDSYNAYHNTLDTLYVCVYTFTDLWLFYDAVIQWSLVIVQFICIHVHALVSWLLIVFYCLRPSWKFDVIS